MNKCVNTIWSLTMSKFHPDWELILLIQQEIFGS
jgi:hypothetical protein